MKILRVALAPMLVLIGGAVTVWANPGDAVAVRGILAWPAILANEPFLVVRADNGRFYYADVTTAERRGTAALRAGNRVAIVGTAENGKPFTAVGFVRAEPGRSPHNR